MAALLAWPALAQSPAPAGKAPDAGAAQADAPAQPSPTTPTQFITAQPAGQWRGSKIVGVTVYGADDQRLGEISELLVDDSGQVAGVVIGLGGFLGIGEKSVAVPFSAIQWRVPAVPSAALPSNAATGLTGGRPANPSPSPAEASLAANTGLPTHPVLNASKEELNRAPPFVYATRGSAAPKPPADAGDTAAQGAPDPAKSDSAKPDPASLNPAKPNPGKADQTKTEPVKPDPAKSELPK